MATEEKAKKASNQILTTFLHNKRNDNWRLGGGAQRKRMNREKKEHLEPNITIA